VTTLREALRMDIREVVADPEWQALRESLVGTWKSQGPENAARLRAYVGDFKDPLRVRRVLNYLTGTGFRSGAIACPEAGTLREEVRAAYAWHRAGCS
jgi:hypothetical protein